MDLDLNSDLGEGCGSDAALMPLLTSANVSCGFHAGDLASVQDALRLAARHGVSFGAHPGYADREHFGRRELTLDEANVFNLCVYQVGAVRTLAQGLGLAVHYLKPHGALYNQACRDESFARPLVLAAKFLGLPVLGLPGSALESLCQGECGFVREGFADRRYQADGSLVPRDRPDAFVHDIQEAVDQADWLVRKQNVRSLCVHGDNPQALEFVRALRVALTGRGWNLRAFA